jgi:squalene-hopene/tetraprenyl-beta-curcumene cyclase
MDKTKNIFGDAHISRRTFTAMCQIALAPAAWFALDSFGSMVNQSLEYLHSRQKNEDDGDWGDVGVTALVTTAVLRGETNSSPTASKGLKRLEEFVQPDGGVYTPGKKLENYETCLAMICLREANVNRRYDNVLQNAAAFIKTCQWDESRGQKQSDITYGGAGYGPERRPDLSNTAFLLDAVKSCNGSPSDPTVQKALLFVSRCQNADNSSDGNGGFRSCASGGSPASGVMTMIGLKSLLAAGVARNDARVKAARAWIRNHYDMTRNPGMGNAGLYHYFHVCAETLLALGMDEIEDAAGVKHNWRNELCTEIVHRQRKDGSWGNENGCWMENDPHIATAHALLALSYCQQPSEKTA